MKWNELVLLVYLSVGMYFGKVRYFQIGVCHWRSNIDYIWQVYFWCQKDLGSDLDEMICMIWSFFLWIFFVWKVYFRPWWIDDEFGRDSSQKRKVLLVSHKVLQHLVYIWQVWICLIDALWFWDSWNYLLELSSLLANLYKFGKLIFVMLMRFCIRSTLIKICLGVLGGILHRQVETPVGSWKMKVFFLEDCWPSI